MNPSSKKHFCLLLLLLLSPMLSLWAQFKIPEIPKFQTSLYDDANLLSESEKKALEQKLIRYSDSTTTQIVVVTTPTINNEDIGILAPKWAHAWGIGQKNEDNGIFILLAAKERRIWIANGYGIEDRLTAGQTGEITRNIILPEFKAGSYYRGLDKGSDAIFDALNGKYKGTRKGDKNSANPFPFFAIILVIVLIIIFSKKGGGRGNNNNGGGFGSTLSDIIILSSLGRGGFGGGSGGGGFSGGGGGFGGGFGGGGFSGGGAGGSW